MENAITVKALINAPVNTVWNKYTKPEHITKWNNASPDWHSPRAKVDFRSGGRFVIRMESKDGKQGFDFSGMYNIIRNNKLIEYTLDDKRKVSITFSESKDKTNLVVTFQAENENPLDLQREGWQSILNNFKNYVENNI